MIPDKPSTTVLEARNLAKQFRTGRFFSRVSNPQSTIHAVENVSLKLDRGHTVALVGESGSGKSTLARLLARLYEPTSGDILLYGRDALAWRGGRALLAYRQQVQFIFQDPYSSLNPVHRVHYLVARPLHVHRKVQTKRETRERVLALMERVLLAPVQEFADKYPHQLSGGQRQRVAIARALAVEPAVILADEPVSMLDVSIRMEILQLMAKLRDEQQIAFLYISHDLASARYFADDLLVMYRGHLVEGGKSQEVIDQPQHPYSQMLRAALPRLSPRPRPTGTPLLPEDAEPDGTNGARRGCPFAHRCPHVVTRCRESMPPITYLSASRWLRCHLYEE